MSFCPFCDLVSEESPSHKIYEDESVLVILDTKPLNPGHTLIITKKHAEHLLESKENEVCSVLLTAKRIAPIIMNSVEAPGCSVNFDVGHSASQKIFHTHVHVIPRFEDDGLEVWKSQSEVGYRLESVAQRIREMFAKI